MKLNDLSREIIGAAMEVHRTLGPGLLENVYENCLAHELALRGLAFKRQQPLPVVYKEVKMPDGHRMDFVVENSIVVEVKAVELLHPIHQAQVITYLRLSGYQIGLLINFNVLVLKDGIKRIVVDYDEKEQRAINTVE